MTKPPRGATPGQEDLFSTTVDPQLGLRLGDASWPPFSAFPVNHGNARVRDHVWADLATSARPLVVAGFASIAKILELVAAAGSRTESGEVRVLLGSEPFASERIAFGSPSAAFSDEVRRYWLEERGVSLLLSAKVIQTIQALDAGWFKVRFVPGRTRMHAKIYVGDHAATLGSSNFTDAGLSTQFEANVRFERTQHPDGYRATRVM